MQMLLACCNRLMWNAWRAQSPMNLHTALACPSCAQGATATVAAACASPGSTKPWGQPCWELVDCTREGTSPSGADLHLVVGVTSISGTQPWQP